MPFKVKFDILDYKKSGLLPPMADYLKHDEIINYKDYEKGNIDKCVFTKKIPTALEIASPEFKERELTRILRTGVWVGIKDTVLWIPGNLYFALNYVNPAGNDMQFRLQRLMHTYFKIEARNNPHCKGTMTIKARQTGETTMAMADAFWETFEMEDGQVTINSKTRSDAQNPCWKTMQAIYMGLPKWLFDTFFGDCQHNGKNIAETIKFLRFADEVKGLKAKNVLLAYYPSVYNALDGKNSVKKAIGDEFLKWLECNFGDWFNNASKFIMPGFQRSGLFDLFSSPPEKDSQSFRDGYDLWKKSDPANLDENGTTESRIHRYYINPLHGIQGSYDKWGDADPNKIYDWIMRERKRQPKNKLLEEIRGFPLNEEEIWGSMEGGHFWDNTEGLKKRQIYLIGSRFKDELTKEPIRIFGNLEWKDGVVDNPNGVDFRPADIDSFDVHEGRFSFSSLPQNIEPLKNIHHPPAYPERVAGADPFGKRYPGKNPSNGALTIYQFRDILQTGINKRPIGLYLNRPYHEDIYFEDVLKACIFCQAPLQFESNNDRIGGYFTDRGYRAWVLPEIGQQRGSDRLGDHVSARGKFMDEMIGLINAHINIPVDPNEKCLLENHYFIELIDDLLKFNLKDTHENDASMSLGQALMGAAKLLFKKQRKPSVLNQEVLNFLLS